MSDDKKKRKQQALMSHLTALRPGVASATKSVALGIEEDKADGLVLSGVQLKEITFFTVNELNTIFEGLKSQEYYEQLKRDIAQDGIINALIALPDGQLIEGHSRLKVAQELGLHNVPVRFILNTLSAAEMKRRVYLGNLNRFEIPFDIRLILFAEIYPDYFYTSAQELDQQHKRSGEKKDVTTEKPSTAKTVAAAMGISDRQVRNEKEVFLRAKELSTQSLPSPQEIAKARELIKQEKESKKKNKKSSETLSILNEYGEPLVTIHVDAWPEHINLSELLEMNFHFVKPLVKNVSKRGI